MPDHEPIEPVLLLLAGLMIFFTAVLFICEIKFANDGQVFQVISGLLTGISGAFLMRIKPRGAVPPPTNGSESNGTHPPATE